MARFGSAALQDSGLQLLTSAASRELRIKRRPCQAGPRFTERACSCGGGLSPCSERTQVGEQRAARLKFGVNKSASSSAAAICWAPLAAQAWRGEVPDPS